MKITFLGAAHEVTGSATLLEVCGKKLLIDCGTEQGENLYENAVLPITPGQLDAICLTHAHIDHCGMLPAMVKAGYSGPIYATEATFRLCEIMLRDAAHIQESEAEWKNRKAKRSGQPPVQPVFDTVDAEQTLALFQWAVYEQPVEILEGVTLRFRDAGHLMGSASIYITAEGRTVLFSGDLGNHTRPLIRDPQPAQNADYVIIESTYGDRTHGPRPDYTAQLTRILQDTFDRGGNLVVPCFAVGRTQELLYLLRGIQNSGALRGHKDFPVYVDSPMAVSATKIYAAGLTGFYDDETLELLARGEDPITFDGLRLSVTTEDSKAINEDKTPKVILSASGMCEAGRIRHHLKHNLWRPDSTVLFVGYQSPGTLGRKLIEGASSVKVFGETVAVRAKIENLNGISGHADREMMLSWLGAMDTSPRRVFVNHGEDTVCDGFADAIRQQLGFNAVAPYSGDEYDLTANTCIRKAPARPIRRKENARNAAYDRLLSAGQRLLEVIRKNKGLANQQLQKFTDRVNALCDQYDRK